MKLLFDQNISPRLTTILSDVYSGASHVRDHGLARADDERVWDFAKANNLVIVSKDADFHQRSFVYGFPPKLIWLRVGNCTTNDLAQLLRTHQEDIERFWNNTEAAFLVLP